MGILDGLEGRPIDLTEFLVESQPVPLFKRPSAVCFLASWIDACALWRMYIPHLNFHGSTFFCFTDKPKYELLAANDIVVVQRCSTQPQYEFLMALQAMGIKLIYDLDDDLWHIPPENPAAKVLENHKEGFKHCIRMTDVVTTSTKTLAKVVKNEVKQLTNVKTGKEIPIVVTENWIDERLFAIPRTQEQPIVGWAGSSSHIGDLKIIEEAIKTLAGENPQVLFEFRGLEPPEGLNQLSNVVHKMWMPVPEFCVRMPLWGWSVALAPVTNEDFNNSKSSIKMIEAAYCEIPCLASWMEPYDNFCSHDKELRWLLCAGKSNWYPKIRELIHDEARRKDLGKRAYRVAKEFYSYDRPHSGWAKAFELALAV